MIWLGLGLVLLASIITVLATLCLGGIICDNKLRSPKATKPNASTPQSTTGTKQCRSSKA